MGRDVVRTYSFFLSKVTAPSTCGSLVCRARKVLRPGMRPCGIASPTQEIPNAVAGLPGIRSMLLVIVFHTSALRYFVEDAIKLYGKE